MMLKKDILLMCWICVFHFVSAFHLELLRVHGIKVGWQQSLFKIWSCLPQTEILLQWAKWKLSRKKQNFSVFCTVYHRLNHAVTYLRYVHHEASYDDSLNVWWPLSYFLLKVSSYYKHSVRQWDSWILWIVEFSVMYLGLCDYLWKHVWVLPMYW
jgi:hypothetical protein